MWRYTCIFLCLLFYFDRTAKAQTDNGDLSYLITLPQALYINSEYAFYVDCPKSLAKIGLTTTELLSNITVKDEDTIIKNEYGQIKYKIPFNNIPGEFVRLDFKIELCRFSNGSTDNFNDCNLDNEANYKLFERSARLRVINDNFIILGETSKPIYKPGDLVQFRFLTLSSTNLQLSSNNAPNQYNIVKSNEGSQYKLSKNKQTDSANEKFSLIYIEDNSKTRLKQWVDVSWKQALNLSYPISNDPVFGKYTIVAHYRSQKTEQKFEVKKYVLPKFSVTIQPPSDIFIKDKTISYGVCATYTNGRKMQGIIKTKLCVEPTYGYYYNNRKKRPCLRKTLQMDGIESCYDVTFNTKHLQLRNSEYPYWSSQAKVEAIVTESGTSESVTKTATGGNLVTQKFSIEFQGSQYYKPGLAHKIEIKATAYDGKPQKDTNIKISGQSFPDYWKIDLNSTNDDTWGFSEYVTTDRNGMAIITIPPIRIKRSITIKAEEADFLEEEVGNDIVRIRQSYISQTLSPWSSQSGIYMKVAKKSMMKSSSTCSPILKLSIEANTQINYPIIYVQIFSRGQLVQAENFIPAQYEEKCKDQDKPSGHYTCIKQEDGEYLLKCKPGWTGNDCSTPICSRSCNYGVCIRPNQCSCQENWSGDNCNKCLPRSQCQNGYCRFGGDCICEEGWTGYRCDKLKSNYTDTRYYADGYEKKGTPDLIFYDEEENNTIPIITESELQAKTIYKRSIKFSLNSMSLPEAVAVVYFKVPRKNGSEIIAESVNLEGLLPKKCISTNEESVFRFDRSNAAPGENVSLLINTGRENNTCCLSARDISLETFQQNSNTQISIDQLISELISINSKIKQVYDNPMKEIIRNFCGDDYYPYPPIYQRPMPIRKKRTVYYPNYFSGTDTAKVFADMGVVALTNYEIFSRECENRGLRGYRGRFYMSAMETESVGGPPPLAMRKNSKLKDNEDLGSKKKKLEARVRQFFPESWLFNIVEDPPSTIPVTVPDTLTTWKASAFCITQQGLWLPPITSLKVTMPFNLQISLPYSVKRDEILRMPVKIFSNLDSCFQVELFLKSNPHIQTIGDKVYTTCICNNQQKTVYFQLIAKMIGELDVEVSAYSQYSSLCQKQKHKISSTNLPSDAVKRKLRVEPEGIPQEINLVNLICLKDNEEQTLSMKFQMPERIVDSSLRNYLAFGGDVMGPSLTNLDRLVRMPYGCGEQNMVSMVPSIYVMDYFTAANINKSDIIEKAKKFIAIGYNRQLNYRRDDGSYSAFGNRDKSGSTWLTAFVYKSFKDAKKYSDAIDDTVLTEALKFLQTKQYEDGCFREDGKVFSSTMKGGIGKGKNQHLLLTAYILSSLSNSVELKAVTLRNNALNCVRAYFLNNTQDTIDQMNNYSLALITYSLGLYQPDDQLVLLLNDKLKSRAIKGLVTKYWSDNSDKKRKDANRFWVTGTSSEVETTAYAYLALKGLDSIGDDMHVIRWLTTQRNADGGFYSTQDTVMGLKAISDFAQLIDVGSSLSLNISASSEWKSIENVELNDVNKLVTNRFDFSLPDNSVVVEYPVTWTLKGTGCVYIQSTAMFNVPSAAAIQSPFSLQVQAVSMEDNCKSYQVTICFNYRDNSNMILLKVNSVSGWTVESTQQMLLKKYSKIGLKRIEIEESVSSLYFDPIELEDDSIRCLTLNYAQIIEVEDSKPAQVSILDYYSPEIAVDQLYSIRGCQTEDTNNQTKLEMESQTAVASSCPAACSADDIDLDKLNSLICSSDSRTLLFQRSTDQQNLVHLLKGDLYLGSWDAPDMDMDDDCDCKSKLSNMSFWVGITKSKIYRGQRVKITNEMVILCARRLQSILSSNMWCESSRFISRVLEDRLSILPTRCPKFVPNYENSLQLYLNEYVCTGKKFFLSKNNQIDTTIDLLDENIQQVEEFQFQDFKCSQTSFFDNNDVVFASSNSKSSNNNQTLLLNSRFVIMSQNIFEMYFENCSL